MNLRRRSIIAIVIVLVVLMTVFVFNQLLYLEPYGFGQPSSSQLTATYIIDQNHFVETLISQTRTATAQVSTRTLTPAPS